MEGPRLTEAHKRLFRLLVHACQSGAGVDSLELQDLLTDAGVLVGEIRHEPCCADDCACADDGAEFPTTCYVLAPFLREGSPR